MYGTLTTIFLQEHFAAMLGETTYDVGGPLTIIANPLLFVALIIVLRKLGLNCNFKEDFFY